MLCNGLYRRCVQPRHHRHSLAASVDDVLEQARVVPGDVEEVLLVGGSTLLPASSPSSSGEASLACWHPDLQ